MKITQRCREIAAMLVGFSKMCSVLCVLCFMEIFSEYLKKDHLLTRIDARIKLLVALSVLIMVISYKGFAFPLLVTLLCLFLCVKMQIPLKVLMVRFSGPIFIASVIVLLKYISGHKDGLIDGLMIASRILGAVSVVIMLGFVSRFTETIAAFSWFKFPKGFIEILMFAYRYIFMLLEEAMVIYNAQKNRLGYFNIRRGLESFGTLTGSLVLRVFDHSHNITAAMIQRGYDGNIPILKHKPFKPSEIIISILIIAAIGLVWII